MKLDSSRSLLIRLFALAVLVLVTPLAIISVRAMGEFERGMIPEMDRKAAAIGRDVASQVERAVGYGIPIDKLVAVEAFFEPLLVANPEIHYLAIADKAGRVLFLSSADKYDLQPYYETADPDVPPEGRKASIGTYVDVALPVAPKGPVIAHVHVGFDQAYVPARLIDILVDGVVVMAVSLIIAFEILLFVVFANVTSPLKRVGEVVDRVRRGDLTHLPAVASGDEVGRFVRGVAVALRTVDDVYRRLMAYIDEVKQGHFDKGVIERVGAIESRINFLFRFSPTGKPQTLAERRGTDIRLPLFLFIFAEELSRSFLPLFAGQVGPAFGGLSAEMAMALPIAVFMACIAIASPTAARLTERFGARKVFLMGLVPAIGGYVLTGASIGMLDLMLWRAVTGFGYAVVTMACQGYIMSSLSQGSRAQGVGVFVGTVLSASICGVALGGMLAERVGYRATFFVSAALVILAGLMISRMLSVDTPSQAEPAVRRPMLRLFANWRFTVLMLFAAVPLKMALTGFGFFLVPVALARGGWDVADIARLTVIYPLVMVVVAPVAARLSDMTGWRVSLVALGGLVGGAGLLAPLLLPDPGLALVVAIAALGAAHGLSASPLLATVSDVCWTECRSYGEANVLAFVRLVERAGSVAGPLLAAAFIPVWGLMGAVVALGAVVLALAGVFAAAALGFGSGPHIETEEEVA